MKIFIIKKIIVRQFSCVWCNVYHTYLNVRIFVRINWFRRVLAQVRDHTPLGTKTGWTGEGLKSKNIQYWMLFGRNIFVILKIYFFWTICQLLHLVLTENMWWGKCWKNYFGAPTLHKQYKIKFKRYYWSKKPAI